MLTAAVPSLIASGGARLHYVDVDGEIAAAALFLCAGREISYWLGGFDERHARNSPSILLLADAVRSSLALGQDRLDLGAGEQEYKQRFADDRSDLEWVRVVTATGPRRLLARSLLRVTEAAYTMARRLPPGGQEILARSRNWTRSRVAGYRGED
jgi:CelD/BcsL family acetyltransferase involved in cellulose biosynthesis